MLIENYKGVAIHHDAKKDIFITNLVILTRGNKKETVNAPRLQKVRDEIDKFLNASTKKPVMKKMWIAPRYEGDPFKAYDVIALNMVSGEIMYKDENGKTCYTKNLQYEGDKCLLHCKENNAIILELNRKQNEISKIKREMGCMRGKLIPVKPEHFEKK